MLEFDTFAALTVLVAEDEALIAVNLITLLEDLGHSVIGPTASARQTLTLVVVVSATADGLQDGDHGIYRVLRKPCRDAPILEVVQRALALKAARMTGEANDANSPPHVALWA